MVPSFVPVTFCAISLMLAVSAHAQAANPYHQCLSENRTASECFTRLGRHAWQPSSPDECKALKAEIEASARQKIVLSWQQLFMNERCHRLGQEHYDGNP